VGRRFGHASSKAASAPLRRARANAVVVVVATVGRWRPSPLRPRAPLCATGGGGSARSYKFAQNAGEQALPCTAFGVQESRRSPAALQRLGTMVGRNTRSQRSSGHHSVKWHKPATCARSHRRTTWSSSQTPRGRWRTIDCAYSWGAGARAVRLRANCSQKHLWQSYAEKA
jgi:hypothetical protein